MTVRVNLRSAGRGEPRTLDYQDLRGEQPVSHRYDVTGGVLRVWRVSAGAPAPVLVCCIAPTIWETVEGSYCGDVPVIDDHDA